MRVFLNVWGWRPSLTLSEQQLCPSPNQQECFDLSHLNGACTSMCLKSPYNWIWNAASSYIILPGKLPLLSCIILLWIKNSKLSSFSQSTACGIGYTALWHCAMWIFLPSLSFCSVHLGLQLSISTLQYNKVFFFLLYEEEIKTKLSSSTSFHWMVF